MHLVSLDYVLIVIYLLLMVIVGVFFGWFVKDVSAYLKGGNSIPWPVAGISNYMSMFSTFVFVAHAGVAYEHGLVAVATFWSTIPACLVAGTWLAARWRRAELTTPVEYLERRYNLSVRQVFTWVGLLMRFLDNAVRLYASGIFLSTVTPLSVNEAIALSGALITVFTMFGGLWAVTVMDTIQFIVLFCATAILVPLSLHEAGGLAGIAAAAPNHLHWFNGPKGAPLWLLAYYVMIVLKYNGNWAFIQRLYAVKDEAAARKVAYCSAVLFLVTPLIFLLPAIAARVVLPDLADPETCYVSMCGRLLPAGMMGLMIASMFAATSSALNSEFNVMAGVLTNDLYKRLLSPLATEQAQFRFARMATVGVGGVITVGAMFVVHVGGAFEANKVFTGIIAIPLAVPLVGGLLVRRTSSVAAVVVVLGGSLLALTLQLGGWVSWEVATLCTVAFCLSVFLVSGWMWPVRSAGVDKFWQQIKTRLPAKAVGVIDQRFLSALQRLFGLSFLVSGAFFALVGLLTVKDLSGRLAVAAGTCCLMAGCAILLRSWRSK